MRAYGYCEECKQYDDLRTVQLDTGKWGYQCRYAGHVFTPQGKTATAARYGYVTATNKGVETWDATTDRSSSRLTGADNSTLARAIAVCVVTTLTA